jgi:hypothetical protein
MSEKPESAESSSPEKLMIDNPSDFRFHAAYLTYSDIFDKMHDLENKKRLNESITALLQGQVDYPTFYRNISQYRGEGASQYDYSRAVIKGQKKREWRRITQKQERIQRHKK